MNIDPRGDFIFKETFMKYTLVWAQVYDASFDEVSRNFHVSYHKMIAHNQNRTLHPLRGQLGGEGVISGAMFDLR